MATTEFGDAAIESQPAQTTEFGDPIVSDALSISPEQAFEQRYIAGQQPDFLRTATTPARLGYDALAGLISSITSGIKGAGELGKQAYASETPISTGAGNIAQTGLESVPRAAFGIADILRQGGRYAMENPQGAIRNLSALVSPIQTAIQESFRPPAPPSEKEVADAVMRELTNQVFAERQAQPIAPEIFGQANIPLAQALPDIAATVMGAPELAALGRGALARVGPVAREVGRTVVTDLVSPRTAYRAAGEVQPYLSGERLASAEQAAAKALADQAALERTIAGEQLDLAQSQAADTRTLTAQRGEAAIAGREALTAGRELKASESTLQPQIINAQTTLEQVAQSPVVILGQTAEGKTAFGRNVIESIEKPLAASKKIYEKSYDAVKASLPEVQPAMEARGLFDAAAKSGQELSEGFEAYNRGDIRKIINQSTTPNDILPSQGAVTQSLRDIYRNLTDPAQRADLLRQYPDLASTSTGVPKYTWNELQARFRGVNDGITQAIKHGTLNDARILGDLKDGIIQDMKAYVDTMGGDTLKLFEDANKRFAEHQDKFGLNRIQSILKEDAIENPQGVAAKLINDDNAPMVEAVKAIVTPDEFKAIQSQFAKKIFSPNVDTPFDPSHFIKKFSDGDHHETYKAVFGQQGFNELQKIYDASKEFEKISDFQKTLDGLRKESESASESFAGKLKKANETENVQGIKERARIAWMKTKGDADLAQKIGSSKAAVESAMKELDRVKNYRELREWLTRATGINILKAAWGSPKGIALNRRLAASGLLAAPPTPEATLEELIKQNQ